MPDRSKGPWGRHETKPKIIPEKKESPDPSVLDLDKVFDQMKKKFNHQFSQKKKSNVILFIAGILLLWALSGFYRVEPSEQGVVLRFGKYVYTTASGLHYHLPWPMELAKTPNVTRENRIEIGFRSHGDNENYNVEEESVMLTGDENFINIHFAVTWFINDAGRYLFNVRNSEQTIKVAAESVMREVVGQTSLLHALTEGKDEVQEQTQKTLQELMDNYQAGIQIKRVELLAVDPPAQVIDSFNDVQRARADAEKMEAQATAYRNEILPKARGDAEKMIQEAEAYKQAVINEATGSANRFEAVLKEYRQAPVVTKKRLYLETMEQVLGNTNKIIIDDQKGSGVLPYLPLSEFIKKEQAK